MAVSDSPTDLSTGADKVERARRVAVVVLLGAFALAVALLIGGYAAVGSSDQQDHDTGVEAVKAGFQLLVVVLAGGAVTAVLNLLVQTGEERRRQRETDQEERRRVNDAALELLRELIATYNRLKASRRLLRAAGLRRPAPEGSLSPAQCEELERQMRALVEIQLTFERIGREIGVRVEDRDRMAGRTGHAAELARMERYVNEVVEEWEDEGGALTASGFAFEKLASLTRFQGFLDLREDDPSQRFRQEVANPLRRLEGFFRAQLLLPLMPATPGGSPATPEDATGRDT